MWKPIETAPKTGELILAWKPHGACAGYILAQWKHAAHMTDYPKTWTSGHMIVIGLSLWTELPTPPELAE